MVEVVFVCHENHLRLSARDVNGSCLFDLALNLLVLGRRGWRHPTVANIFTDSLVLVVIERPLLCTLVFLDSGLELARRNPVLEPFAVPVFGDMVLAAVFVSVDNRESFHGILVVLGEVGSWFEHRVLC